MRSVCCWSRLRAVIFDWEWFALYAVLPVAVAVLLWQAKQTDRAQRGTWRDFLVLAALGLAVDLRWFERAWPPHLGDLQQDSVARRGDLWIPLRAATRWRWVRSAPALRDLAHRPARVRLVCADRDCAGSRRWAFCMCMRVWPQPSTACGSHILFTFVFIAIPEELFFRGWMQNLLERRLGRTPALLVTAVLFGLSHFNKRAAHFNWRYVVLAMLAGIFYGRAWRRDRRVGASAITHACVDTVWSQWLR